MKSTPPRPAFQGSVLTSLAIGALSLAMIALLGGFGVAFMGGVLKHKRAAAAAAAEEALSPAAPAPTIAAAAAPATAAPAAPPAAAPVSSTAQPAPAGEAKPAGDAKVIEIGTHAMQFLYLVTEFTVKSGEKVQINFKNTSTQVPQPHNLIICKPGKKGVIEAAAMAMMTDPEGLKKGYIPVSEEIFAHTKLIQPGQSELLEFVAPAPGKYDYLCTFPGHWILMKGVMTVE